MNTKLATIMPKKTRKKPNSFNLYYDWTGSNNQSNTPPPPPDQKPDDELIAEYIAKNGVTKCNKGIAAGVVEPTFQGIF
ncbi:hypothetical protein ACQU0X_26955 [Pseudovibrio ascidiaceicola]|uniref:hypothetical protein n=1 Tax=Pseudovibrio ascidiaceicola TaxID=285279 RepID=UPI003D364A6E